MDDITENAANEIWYRAKIQNNPRVYEIMKYINKTPRYVIINRNPTINFGSLICMRVKDIKNDFNEDYTLNLPLQVLPALNADFDGKFVAA